MLRTQYSMQLKNRNGLLNRYIEGIDHSSYVLDYEMTYLNRYKNKFSNSSNPRLGSIDIKHLFNAISSKDLEGK